MPTELISFLGYSGIFVMGFVLGSMGGGGSILTVPILVYLFRLDPVLATAYSLIIVGLSAFSGVARKANSGTIQWKIGFLFGLPSIAGVFLTRAFLMPAIPEQIVNIGSFSLSRSFLIMLVFALSMLLVAYFMLKPKKDNTRNYEALSLKRILYIMLEGLGVGIFTGFIGAGGGFLIVPALVLLAGLEISKAIGTSLLIIGLKSTIGFSGDLIAGLTVDWIFIGLLLIISIVGIMAGSFFADKIDAKRMRKLFAYFLLVMAGFIIINETVNILE